MMLKIRSAITQGETKKEPADENGGRPAAELKSILAQATAAPAILAARDNRYYVNSSEHLIYYPPARPRALRMAEYGDWSMSYSEDHRETRSHHGGVAHWD